MAKREEWKSRLGFIWAAVGSAVGLGSIWRFPYIVGENGGAVFVLLYLVSLALIGFPVLLTEITLGRKGKTSPYGVFKRLGRSKWWGYLGLGSVVTGFIVSTFYGVISGWTLGYIVETARSALDPSNTFAQYQGLTSSASFSAGYLIVFMLIAGLILYCGVRKGIERASKVMMPLLLGLLLLLVVRGLSMEGSSEGIKFLFSPDFSQITPAMVLLALGQAFFSLSLGQGTMLTYGSYVSDEENLPFTCFPIAFSGVLISLLAGIAIFSVAFATNTPREAGPGLMFQTIPLAFAGIPFGSVFTFSFFVLLFVAALSSQISALEPLIAFLIDEKKWSRHVSVICTCALSLFIGLFAALSFGVLSDISIFGYSIFDGLVSLCLNVLIPLGGFAAVLLLGWRYGWKKGLNELRLGTAGLMTTGSLAELYLRFVIKYLAPLLILVVLIWV